MKLSLHFLWYDIWVGAYVDRKNSVLYICPLPMILIKLEFKDACLKHDWDTVQDSFTSDNGKSTVIAFKICRKCAKSKLVHMLN